MLRFLTACPPAGAPPHPRGTHGLGACAPRCEYAGHWAWKGTEEGGRPRTRRACRHAQVWPPLTPAQQQVPSAQGVKGVQRQHGCGSLQVWSGLLHEVPRSPEKCPGHKCARVCPGRASAAAGKGPAGPPPSHQEHRLLTLGSLRLRQVLPSACVVGTQKPARPGRTGCS